MANASYLAEAMGDIDWIKACDSGMLPGLPLKLYGITCTVDTSMSIEMRNATLTPLDSLGATNSYARSLSSSSSQPCEPLDGAGSEYPVTDKLRVIAALDPWQPLEVGLVEQLRQLLTRPSGNHQTTLYAFAIHLLRLPTHGMLWKISWACPQLFRYPAPL